MTQRIKHFLLIFDHDQGSLLKPVEEFGEDGDRALAAYAQSEQDYRDRPKIEIVLIGSDSLETVTVTHANYFDGSVAVSKYLLDIS